MEGFSNLIEFAIALAGFTSIVVVFAHKDEKWKPLDKFRITNALMGSVGAAFLAATPYGLLYVGLSDQLIWQVEGLLVGSYILLLLISVLTRRNKNLPKDVRQQLPRKLVATIIILGLIYALLIFTSLIGVVGWSIKGLGYFGIIYLLLISMFAFFRLLFYRPIDDQSE